MARLVAAVALIGGRLALDGEISVGQFIAAIGITQFLVGPFSLLGNLIGSCGRTPLLRCQSRVVHPTAA